MTGSMSPTSPTTRMLVPTFIALMSVACISCGPAKPQIIGESAEGTQNGKADSTNTAHAESQAQAKLPLPGRDFTDLPEETVGVIQRMIQITESANWKSDPWQEMFPIPASAKRPPHAIDKEPRWQTYGRVVRRWLPSGPDTRVCLLCDSDKGPVIKGEEFRNPIVNPSSGMIPPGIWRFRSLQDVCFYLATLTPEKLKLHTAFDLEVYPVRDTKPSQGQFGLFLTPYRFYIPTSTQHPKKSSDQLDHWEHYPWQPRDREHAELWSVYRWEFTWVKALASEPGISQIDVSDQSLQGHDPKHIFAIDSVISIDYFRPIFRWLPKSEE